MEPVAPFSFANWMVGVVDAIGVVNGIWVSVSTSVAGTVVAEIQGMWSDASYNPAFLDPTDYYIIAISIYCQKNTATDYMQKSVTKKSKALSRSIAKWNKVIWKFEAFQNRKNFASYII